MHIVQQMGLIADGQAHRLEQLGRVAQVLATIPVVLGRHVAIGRLVHSAGGADPVDLVQAGHAALCPDGAVAFFLVAQHLVDGFGDVASSGVSVDHHAAAAAPAEQLVKGLASDLGLDVPQRGVHRCNGGHRDRAAPPVRALVEVVPDVLELLGVAPDQAVRHMVLQIAGHRQFAAIECGVADAGQALVGFDLEGHEVAARAADDDAGGRDFHAISCKSSVMALSIPSSTMRPCQ